MPEVPEHAQWDHHIGLPLVRLQTSPGECPQGTLPSEERWPGQCESWWGWIFFWRFLGNLLCFRCQRRARPGRHCAVKEKGTQQKKADSLEKLIATMAADDPLREDLETQLERLRAALKDPCNPGRDSSRQWPK